MKRLLILILSVIFCVNFGYACSMYKITINGKTIVGNNEDWFSANCQIWFEPKGKHRYGVMNVGFDNNFIQGSINEAGLMFDGFTTPHKEVKNTEGKKKVSIDEFIAPIMHNCSTVKEVRDCLLEIDLSFLSDAMVVFIDKSGEYLIVEGDELILGDDSEQSFSNFYPSECSNRMEVPISFYQNGLAYINETEARADFDYCGEVMNHFKQDITVYTTVYDLESGIIRLYHYQNFKDYIEINLEEELKKGKHTMFIPDLFSKNSPGYRYYEIFKDPELLKVSLKETIKKNTEGFDGKALKGYEPAIIDLIKLQANVWEESFKDYNGVVAILDLSTELFPENYLGYSYIGDVYYENGQLKLAEEYYNQSLILNKGNKEVQAKLGEIENSKG
ncbi:linear amide C-N hydrolase [Formosa sp. S-31]|uniref:linear amide C-N hydrolase n=1 Tax=Formosa sp. S-31 TaxID=2790949 RepID=UPI003EBE5E6B